MMSRSRSLSSALLLSALAGAFAAGNWVGVHRSTGAIDHLSARVERLEWQAPGRSAAASGRPTVHPMAVADRSVPADADVVESVALRLVEEMGLLSPAMLRERQSSFAELYASGPRDDTTYGTASYLGAGYFITVKHAVGGVAGERAARVRLRIGDTYVRASVVDAGDADGEVDPGDWAILKVDQVPAIRPLRIDLSYAYPFADPVARMGNDYSRGIIATTGHVGQHRNGLVTCLTDGHPGVSGGGVLNRAGDLVGIQVGRLDGDFRFSFILPLRAEMFRALREVPLAFAEPSRPGAGGAADTGDPATGRLAGSVATGGRSYQP